MTFKKKARIAAGLLALAAATTPAFVRAYTLNGPSMAPTLLLADRVIALRAAYDFRLPFTDSVLFRTSEPRRGDVVVYRDLVKECLAIKRVVGLPGDTVELRDNRLLVNGVEFGQVELPSSVREGIPGDSELGEVIALERIPSRPHAITYTHGAGEAANHGPTTVPESGYFLLGDHRDNSQDSRFIGCVTRDQIKGRVAWGLRRYAIEGH